MHWGLSQTDSEKARRNFFESLASIIVGANFSDFGFQFYFHQLCAIGHCLQSITGDIPVCFSINFCPCRIGYSLLCLEKLHSESMTRNNKLHFLYDIACTLKAHIKVACFDLNMLLHSDKSLS